VGHDLDDQQVVRGLDRHDVQLDAPVVGTQPHKAPRLVSSLVEAAPGVRVLATSREPLSVSGEHVLPLPPLDLPPAGTEEPLNRIGQNEAVMLLTQRAAAASGEFTLTEANRAAVVSLCRRLDGLPLAIELAAVRTRVLSVEQILAHLTDRFALLTSGSRAALPRHQTLRTAIDWSHDLLDADERIMLRRLGVFAARFTLEDVQGVCTSEGLPAARVLDVLNSLIDKSLVSAEPAGPVAFYRLYETIREYARLRLREAGEDELLGPPRWAGSGSPGPPPRGPAGLTSTSPPGRVTPPSTPKPSSCGGSWPSCRPTRPRPQHTSPSPPAAPETPRVVNSMPRPAWFTGSISLARTAPDRRQMVLQIVGLC
jgi:hypothetical protein